MSGMFGLARDRRWAWPAGMSAQSAVPLQRSDQSGTRERSVWSQQPAAEVMGRTEVFAHTFLASQHVFKIFFNSRLSVDAELRNHGLPN